MKSFYELLNEEPGAVKILPEGLQSRTYESNCFIDGYSASIRISVNYIDVTTREWAMNNRVQYMQMLREKIVGLIDAVASTCHSYEHKQIVVIEIAGLAPFKAELYMSSFYDNHSSCEYTYNVVPILE